MHPSCDFTFLRADWIALVAVCAGMSVPGVTVARESADPQGVPYAGAPGWAETKDQRMAWFKEAKFGMFIHWGLYSPAGGYWPPDPQNGTRYPQHYAEWIRTWAKVPEPEYGRLTKPLFRPEPGCTEGWAQLAREAGMRYAVLTTKHHDGYTLFNARAAYSKQNPVTGSTNISPAGRDLVAEYADAMRAQGMKVGYYYSLIDWQHPDAFPHSRQWPLRETPNHDAYVSYLHQHVEQLLADYGKSDILWVDYSGKDYQGSTWKTRELLEQVRRLQPHAIIDNRFWDGLQNPYGDFFTPEKYVPPTGFPGRTFEVCHTLNESFGFSQHDQKWKSGRDVVHLLVDIVSKGGNLLLNVGPDARGRIPQPAVKALRETGQWLATHGEAIYGTNASPFDQLSFDGRCTSRILEDGNARLYLHLLTWPEEGRILVEGLSNNLRGAVLLGSNVRLATKRIPQGVRIELPPSAANSLCPVVVLHMEGEPKIDRTMRSPEGKE